MLNNEAIWVQSTVRGAMAIMYYLLLITLIGMIVYNAVWLIKYNKAAKKMEKTESEIGGEYDD